MTSQAPIHEPESSQHATTTVAEATVEVSVPHRPMWSI